MTSVVAEVESLYRQVVTDPDVWVEESFSDWVESVSQHSAVDRDSAKYLLRSVRVAQRLRAFWIADTRVVDESIPWRSRVDLALGPKAWRPVLELCRLELDASKSYEAFAATAELFEVVNNAPFMDGMSHADWLAEVGGTDTVR
jgi:hypothetical protein